MGRAHSGARSARWRGLKVHFVRFSFVFTGILSTKFDKSIRGKLICKGVHGLKNTGHAQESSHGAGCALDAVGAVAGGTCAGPERRGASRVHEHRTARAGDDAHVIWFERFVARVALKHGGSLINGTRAVKQAG